MADKYLEELAEALGMAGTDLMYLVNQPSGDDKKITFDNLMGSINSEWNSPHSLDYHDDVNAPAPTEQEALIWDDGTSMWIPGIGIVGVHDHVDFTGAGTRGFVPDPVTDGQFFFLMDDGTWAPPPTSPVGGLALNMRWDTNTAATDPGAGNLKVNNADASLATELYSSETTDPGNDAGVVFANINPGDYLGIWETIGDTETVYYLVSGLTTDNGGWWTIPVTYIGGVGTPENNRPLNFFVIESPDRYIPDLGLTEQVMMKESDVDYDLDWYYTMNWKNVWVAGETYYPQNVVRDGDWTMAANQITDERPAPQAVGDPFYYYGGTLSPFQQSAKIVFFGNRYTVGTSSWVTGYRVETVIGNHYEVYSVDDPNGSPIIRKVQDFTGVVDGWHEFNISPTILLAGQELDLIAVVNEPDPTPTTWTGDWNYTTPQNTGVPAAATVIHASKSAGVIRFADSDTGGDKSGLLLALTAGDIIEALGIRWSIQSVTDGGVYVEFGVSPATQGIPDGLETFTFETVVATPITVGREIDAWLADAQVEGLYIADGAYADIVPDDNAYGTDLLVQEGTASADWDLVAYSAGGGGGGGGGGGLEPHNLNYHEDVTITTPLDQQVLTYDDGTGMWVNLAPGVNPADYVQVIGDTMTGPLTIDSSQQTLLSAVSSGAGSAVISLGAESDGVYGPWFFSANATGRLTLLNTGISANNFLELAPDLAAVRVGGSLDLEAQGGHIYRTAGGAIFNAAAGDTVVSIGPSINDPDTGFGVVAADVMQMIVGGVNTANFFPGLSYFQTQTRYQSAYGNQVRENFPATYAPNCALYNYFDLNMASATTTLLTPLNPVEGWTGTILCRNQAANRTLSFGGNTIFFDTEGNNPPGDIALTANEAILISLYCVKTTRFIVSVSAIMPGAGAVY